MAKYDVFPNPAGSGYLLDVQTELLDYIDTRVVVPLLPVDQAPVPAKRLNPVFEIDGASMVLVTQSLASVPHHILRDPITNFSNDFAEITNALDMVFQGF